MNQIAGVDVSSAIFAAQPVRWVLVDPYLKTTQADVLEWSYESAGDVLRVKIQPTTGQTTPFYLYMRYVTDDTFEISENADMSGPRQMVRLANQPCPDCPVCPVCATPPACLGIAAPDWVIADQASSMTGSWPGTRTAHFSITKQGNARSLALLADIPGNTYGGSVMASQTPVLPAEICPPTPVSLPCTCFDPVTGNFAGTLLISTDGRVTFAAGATQWSGFGANQGVRKQNFLWGDFV